jgi:hypothetical protein
MVARRAYDLRGGEVGRRLGRMRRVRIGQAQNGVVRVAGSIRAGGELLRSPVTHRPCAAFRVAIEVSRGGRKREMELADARPFFIADDSGEAVVDTGAGPFSLALFWDRKGSNRFFARSDDDLRTVRGLLESANISTTTFMGGSRLIDYREAVLLVGAKPLLINNWRKALDE